MTRETKIGLLVGLAFILVVGILLSEHITGSNDRPAAPLADAGHGVRTGVSAPGAATDEPARLPEPQQPVPTPADLTPRPPVTQVTVVTPTDNQGSSTVVVTAPQQPMAQPQPQPLVTPVAPVVVRAPVDPFANDPIARIAKQVGEVVVPVNAPVDATNTAKTTSKLAANATGVREYKAQPGDTLSRLAALLPGGNVKANRDAVVSLNPSLQKDPNRILSGNAYLLPTAGAAKTIVVQLPTPKADAKPEAKALDVAQRTYVVKAGDTLSKIASIELGSKSEIETIRKLNADLLKGRDVIKVDMKLKLPAKAAMASIQ
ncbi:MAG TPA: LysM peptidoglycan-binding domain-containing protein [Tepidisphaeraceae bacterium]